VLLGVHVEEKGTDKVEGSTDDGALTDLNTPPSM
jgi:hypothetical protein